MSFQILTVIIREKYKLLSYLILIEIRLKNVFEVW